MSKLKKIKIDKTAIKKAMPRAIPRVLPLGALFLPLGTISINFLIEKVTRYNIVELVKAPFSESNELFATLLKSESMAAARIWLVVAVAGLALAVLAVLAGLALCWSGRIKLYAASAAVYAAGTLGAAGMGYGFAKFGTALAGALMNIATTSLNIGLYVLGLLLLANAVMCFVQWRSAKEKARLAALAAKKRKKK